MSNDPARSDITSSSAPFRTLLDSSVYLERFRVAQASIHKSLLVILAIVAFWLTIERNYDQYKEYQSLDDKKKLTIAEEDARDTELQVIQSRIKKAKAEAEANASEGSFILNLVDLDEELKSAKKAKDVAAQARQESSKELRAFKKETVNLSVAGTSLPSRPSLAPAFWLLACLGWLIYLSAKRGAAYRNVAAYVAALKPEERAFGAAGEGSMWVVPLPSEVRIGVGAEALRVGDVDILNALGWFKRTEQRYILALAIFASFVGLLAMRMLFISIDIQGQFAVDNEIVGEESRTIIAILTLALAAACLFYLSSMLIRPATDSVEAEPAFGPRRAFVTFSLAFGVFIVAFKRRDMEGSTTTTVAATDTSAARKGTRVRIKPRFIPQSERATRRKNFATIRTMADQKLKKTLIHNSEKGDEPPRPGRASLHYANAQGRVRYFSTVAKGSQFKALTVEQAINRTTVLDKIQPTFSDCFRTHAWEAAALDAIRDGRVDEAIRLLDAGARQSLQAAKKPNIRLLDLLAGLYAHRNDEAKLRELIAAVETLARETPSGRGARALLERAAKWGKQESQWRRRWTRTQMRPKDKKQPDLVWHHCHETRSYKWTRTRKFDTFAQRPPNPEVRHAPVKIA